MPMATPPVQEHIPFWYPGNPVTAGRFDVTAEAEPPLERLDGNFPAWWTDVRG